VLRIRGLTVAYGGGEPVLEALGLEVGAGKFVSLLGPSGSGKTSVLRAVTGLLRPREGAIELDVGANEIGFLFQDDALLPWRTARQNVALGLRIHGAQRAAAEETAERWLGLLGLEGFGSRYPRQLSGGQRKRVAIAQVLALEPKLLLMDEPFASLDAIVRTRITQELLRWVEEKHLTVLLVTHDLEEAISASDTVYVLSQGPVPMPRPRDVVEARRDPAFGPLLKRLWDDLREAVA
jgi:NitT/TauT family transport system ATP-binding protein